MEIKNMACYKFKIMSYLYIKKGEDYIKTEKFQKNIGGTAACMKILMMSKIGCDQLT